MPDVGRKQGFSFQRVPRLNDLISLKWENTGETIIRGIPSEVWKDYWGYALTGGTERVEEVVYRYGEEEVGDDTIPARQGATSRVLNRERIVVLVREDIAKIPNKAHHVDPDTNARIDAYGLKVAADYAKGNVNMKLKGSEYILTDVSPWLGPTAMQEYLQLTGVVFRTGIS